MKDFTYKVYEELLKVLQSNGFSYVIFSDYLMQVCVLAGNNVERIREEYQATLKQERKPQRPELWDGHTTERVLEAITSSTL